MWFEAAACIDQAWPALRVNWPARSDLASCYTSCTMCSSQQCHNVLEEVGVGCDPAGSELEGGGVLGQ